MKYVPIQPLATDELGILRFQKNTIVDRLLKEGPYTLNDIATWDVTEEERQQFSMLIGYSLSGFSSLSHCTQEVYEASYKARDHDLNPANYHLTEALETLKKFRKDMAPMIAALYDIHPDDLTERII